MIGLVYRCQVLILVAPPSGCRTKLGGSNEALLELCDEVAHHVDEPRLAADGGVVSQDVVHQELLDHRAQQLPLDDVTNLEIGQPRGIEERAAEIVKRQYLHSEEGASGRLEKAAPELLTQGLGRNYDHHVGQRPVL